MIIKILGTGCPNCEKLEANTKQALEESGIEGRVEKVTDVQEIIRHGIMSTPAIVADDKVLSYGVVPSVDEIKKLLASEAKTMTDAPAKKCSCGSCSCGK